MSGTYRMQPPSPFPYSGGSRMEQALVPALQGPNSNSMIGYALGAQLQRQADQMGYEREMDEYNLTTQQEAGNARQEAAALRRDQLRSNVLTSIINNPAGAAMVPESYDLVTPEQRSMGNRALTAQTDLRIAQAEAAGRRGTGTGATRPDPYTLREFGSALTDERTISTRLATLNNPATVDRAVANATKEEYDPVRKAAIEARVRQAFVDARTSTEAELATARERRTALRPGGTPAAAAPAGNATPAQPQAAPAPAGGGTAAPATAAPAAAPQAVNPGALPAEALASARARAAQLDGGQVRVSTQTGRPVVLDKAGNVVQRF